MGDSGYAVCLAGVCGRTAWWRGRREVTRGLCRCSGVGGGWRRAQDGWQCCGCRELISQEPTPMETQASEEPHPSCTLPCLPVARALDLSSFLSPSSSLTFISPPSLALSRFYPISFVTFVSSGPSPRPLAPITQRFHRLLHSILGSTQLQRNRRAILGDKVTS